MALIRGRRALAALLVILAVAALLAGGVQAEADDSISSRLEAYRAKHADDAETETAAPVKDTADKTAEIVVGVDSSLPLYETDANGQPVGYHAEMVAALLDAAGYQAYRFVALTPGVSEAQLTAGAIDLAACKQGEVAAGVESYPYLTAKGKLVTTGGDAVDLAGDSFVLAARTDSATLVDALSTAIDKADIAGTTDRIYQTYFQTGALYESVAAVRRWGKSVWREFERNLIKEDRYMMIVNGLGTTILIALCSVVFGVLLGCMIALMRLSEIRIGRWRFLQTIAKWYVDIIRGTPVVVQLMIMYYIILSSPDIPKVVTAIVSFSLNSAAYVSEMVRGGILSVDKGQTEAGRSLGLSGASTMLLIVLPQAIKIIIPSLFNEFITLLKETSVCGMIALMDLTKAADYIRSRTYSPFFPLLAVAAIYLVIVSILTRVFGRIERRLRQSDNR